VDTQKALEEFDREVRQGLGSTSDLVRFERVGPVIRSLSVAEGGWSAVLWSDLSGSDADQVIAEQVAFFDGHGVEFEWKWYAYDTPEDLPERLERAGFVPDEPEALVVAEAAALAEGPVAGDAFTIHEVVDDAGIEAYLRAQFEAFGRDHHPEVVDALREQLASDRTGMIGVVAMAGERPISAARVEFMVGTRFAGLWGGGTVPEWRGRGVYTAMVRYRARLAVARGYRYLQVDALPTSEPILTRLGFTRLTTTVPYTHAPPDGVS
jgi:GNAT superfamily N-acetyltransferase